MFSVEKIIKDLELEKTKLVGNELRACCPSPQHEDSKPSWSLNIDSGFYNCWSCSMSGKGLVGLYLKLGKRIPQELEDLQEKSEPKKKRAKKPTVVIHPVLRNTWLTWLTRNTEHAFQELRERGVNREVLDKFRVGSNVKRNVLYFPLLDKSDNLIAWGERCEEWGQRFLMKPANVIKGDLLYGEQFIQEGEKNTVYVVEGFVDCLKMWQWGFKAVALMGNRISETQAARIIDLAEKVLVIPDNDKPGLLLRTDLIKLKINEKVLVYGVNLPEELKDVGQAECTLEVLKTAIKGRVRI